MSGGLEGVLVHLRNALDDVAPLPSPRRRQPALMLAIKESELRRGRLSTLAGGEKTGVIILTYNLRAKAERQSTEIITFGPSGSSVGGGGVVRWMRTLCYYPPVSGPQLNYNYRVSEEDRELMGPRPSNELWGG